jgi:hypothetical protein
LEKEAAAKHKEKRRRNKTKRHQPPQIKQFVRNKGSQQKASRKQPQNHNTSLRIKNNYYFRQNKNSQNQINKLAASVSFFELSNLFEGHNFLTSNSISTILSMSDVSRGEVQV